MQEKPAKIYLSGPIEFATDGGVGWRKIATDYLRAKGFEVFNPIESSLELLNSVGINSVQEYNDLKKMAATDSSLMDKYIEATRLFIDYDIKQLKSSDIVFALLDKTASGGTAGELTVARDICLPVIALANKNEMIQMSAWVFSCVNEIIWFNPETFAIEFSEALEDLANYLEVVIELKHLVHTEEG